MISGNYYVPYEDALRYVEENGVHTYGGYVRATPKAMLRLIEDGKALPVALEDAWISFW